MAALLAAGQAGSADAECVPHKYALLRVPMSRKFQGSKVRPAGCGVGWRPHPAMVAATITGDGVHAFPDGAGISVRAYA